MTRNLELTSINCTACGAGLDVLGGGRVKTHVCSYCGTELDALDDYQALRQFSDMPRPDSPFRIGMSGDIDGVRFQIIGTLGMQESWSDRTWKWAEHQLFSPTHGYAFLSVEDGHLIFSRRFRRVTSPATMSTRWVETAETPPIVHDGPERYKYYETSMAEITFVEGEFTWRPTIGDLTQDVSAMSEWHMLTFSRSKSEMEVYRSKYLPFDETITSFGVEKPPRRRGTHPLQPHIPYRDEGFFKTVGGLFVAVALFGAFYFWAGNGQRITAEQTFQLSALPTEISIEVTDANRLVRLDMWGDANNSWAWIDVTLYDPEDKPLFNAGRTVEYYSGHDSDGRWTENGRSASLRFRPTMVGTHVIEVDVTENQRWISSGTPVSEVRLSAREGLSTPMWLFFAAASFALVPGWMLLRRAMHQRARWRGTDWTEEDA